MTFVGIIVHPGFALEKGIHINADNFCEIDVIAEELNRMNWLVATYRCSVFLII